MIRATTQDRPAIEAFLTKHIATSMFPLSNLRRYGMTGDHRHVVSFWVRWQDGMITDVLTMTNEGVLFPQCPTGPWGAIKAVLAGTAIMGALGDAGQVSALRHALGLCERPAMDTQEPLYRLRLAALRMPDVTGFSLRPLAQAPRDLVIGWRHAYINEVMPMPGEDAARKAADDIAVYSAADTHRVLYEEDMPVAMTGFNATVPNAVQIGGVYTPPAERSRGLARRAVAMHLSEARGKGVTDASLFAASPQACKAYEALGFARTGAFAILIFPEPQVIYG